MRPLEPTPDGFYGEYGGAFIPEMLYPMITDLQESFVALIEEARFQIEYKRLLRDYVGRPTPLYYSQPLSRRLSAQVFLKREDLAHTGAHKINNTLGQILVAKRLHKKRIIAETGAGQHGVATATVCALMNMPCTIFMGELDMERQALNVSRMKMLGAEVIAVNSGSRTLKDATNEAIREWINHPQDTHYIIGSVVGPHPYPDMVARFQSVISEEMRKQLTEKTGDPDPDYVVACLGGGSNAMGAFYHFIGNGKTRLIAVEAAGEGIETGRTAATIAAGRRGILHGSLSYLMQTDDGQVTEPHSIAAGLDYPGVGPVHAYLRDVGLATVVSITDHEALLAAESLARTDGIIPALESAHALAYLPKMKLQPDDVVVVNLSGRGDKDMHTYQTLLNSDQ